MRKLKIIVSKIDDWLRFEIGFNYFYFDESSATFDLQTRKRIVNNRYLRNLKRFMKHV
jgi:hypothetical protein